MGHYDIVCVPTLTAFAKNKLVQTEVDTARKNKSHLMNIIKIDSLLSWLDEVDKLICLA